MSNFAALYVAKDASYLIILLMQSEKLRFMLQHGCL